MIRFSATLFSRKRDVIFGVQNAFFTLYYANKLFCIFQLSSYTSITMNIVLALHVLEMTSESEEDAHIEKTESFITFLFLIF